LFPVVFAAHSLAFRRALCRREKPCQTRCLERPNEA
jgi:hypothetical protein